MIYNMSAPKKDFKGLWTTEITNEEGRVVLIVKKTTKKSLLQWMKANKNTTEF